MNLRQTVLLQFESYVFLNINPSWNWGAIIRDGVYMGNIFYGNSIEVRLQKAILEGEILIENTKAGLRCFPILVRMYSNKSYGLRVEPW